MSLVRPLFMPALLATVCTLFASACHDSQGLTRPSAKTLAAADEIRVNEVTASDQQAPAVASNRHGQSVVVWESRSEGPSYYDIHARLYQQGVARGAPLLINSYLPNRQSLPAVAMDDAGNFVVAWRSSLQQGNGGTIFARRYGSDGQPQGAEFQVGPANSEFDSQSEPAVAMSPDGKFVIVWSNRELSEAAKRTGLVTIETRTIQASLYAADGTLSKGLFDVITPTPFSIVRAPSVAMNAEGGFVVTWISESNPAGVRLRQFGPGGVGEPTQTISDARDDAELDHPSVAMNTSGDYAVAWEATFYGSGLLDGIYFKRHSAASNADSAQRKAGRSAAGRAEGGDLLERVAIALNDAGDLLISAQGEDRIYAQLFDTQGQASDVLALSHPDYASIFPSTSLDNNGQATVVWQSHRQDGDGRGIYLKTLRVR